MSPMPSQYFAIRTNCYERYII